MEVEVEVERRLPKPGLNSRAEPRKRCGTGPKVSLHMHIHLIYTQNTHAAAVLLSLRLLHGQEKLELRRELLLCVKAIRKIYSADSAIGVDLHAERLDVVGTVRATGKVRQVELDLIPTLVQPHGHRADERLHARGGLIVGCPEASSDILVVQDLHFEREVLLQILNDHDEEGKLDAQRLLRVGRTVDVVGADVSAHDFQNTGLNVLVCDPLDVPIPHDGVPDL